MFTTSLVCWHSGLMPVVQSMEEDTTCTHVSAGLSMGKIRPRSCPEFKDVRNRRPQIGAVLVTVVWLCLLSRYSCSPRKLGCSSVSVVSHIPKSNRLPGLLVVREMCAGYRLYRHLSIKPICRSWYMRLALQL